jgi:hypothetical protein
MSKFNPPTISSIGQTYTFSGLTWKSTSVDPPIWEKSSSTETGNEIGATGSVAYYGITGSTIQGATALHYDDTNLRVGIGTTLPQQSLHIIGGGVSAEGATFGKLQVGSAGITCSGGIHVGQNIILSDDAFIGKADDDERIIFDSSANDITLKSSNVYIDRKLRHAGDSDTWFEFLADEINLVVGNSEESATFTTNHKVELGDVNNASNSTKLVITDTTEQVDITGSLNVIGGGLDIQSGGATFANNVSIQNAGDVSLTVKGDTDNSGENDNPLIRLEQDGAAVSCNIGINGESNNQFTGAQPNAFYIEAESSSGSANQLIQFATDNNDRMTIKGDGNIGINNSNPQELLHISGGGISAEGAINIGDGATFSGDVYFKDNTASKPKLKDYSETFHDVGDINASTAFDFENGNVQKCKVTGTDTGSQIVFSLSNPPASGTSGTMTVLFEQGNAHGDVAFHSSIEFPGGNAPTLTATSGKMDVISFLTVDGGTTYYAFVGGLNFTIN